MIEKLQKKYALSRQGAKDLVKGCIGCVLQNLSFSGRTALLFCGRYDERRCQCRKKRVLYRRMLSDFGFNLYNYMVPIQCHIFCYLYGKRR